MNTHRIHGFIPARGGSKGLPKKNIKQFNGFPLLYYPYAALKQCELIGSIVCSTEDTEVADVAESYGIEVHHRPKELANDNSNIVDALINYVDFMHVKPDYLVIAQPTNPFILPATVHQLLAKVLSANASSGHTLTLPNHSQHYLNQRKINTGNVEFLFPSERAKHANRQTKPKVFGGGNLWVVKVDRLLAEHSIYPDPCIGEVIEWPYNADIDNIIEFKVFEAVLKYGIIQLPHLVQ